MESKEEERQSAPLKVDIQFLDLEQLPRIHINENYRIETRIKEGGFGKVYRVMRKSDRKKFAAKFMTMKKIYEDSELLRPYVQREISYLTSIDSNKIMKLEDQCFVSGPSEFIKKEHLVMICELAEGNLDDFIKSHKAPIPEERIMQIFV